MKRFLTGILTHQVVITDPPVGGTDGVNKDYIDNLLFDKNMKRLIDEDGLYIYIGNSQPGTGTTLPAWSIKRIEIKSDGDIDVLWADGVNSYTKVWDDRITYTYN